MMRIAVLLICVLSILLVLLIRKWAKAESLEHSVLFNAELPQTDPICVLFPQLPACHFSGSKFIINYIVWRYKLFCVCMLVGAKRMDTKQDVEKQGKSEQKRRKPGSYNSCRNSIVLYSMQSWPKHADPICVLFPQLPVCKLIFWQ